jgi:hypothetical protein
MNESNKEKVLQFIEFLKEQIEAGLIIIKNSSFFIEIEELLLSHKYKQAFFWKEILTNLKDNQSTFLYINGEFTKELYDIFIQFSNRGGVIQIINPQNMDLVQVELDQKKVNLIYLFTQDALKIAQEKYEILSKAGMIENIE